jgi:prepilin-type N-terminal cleavage/methylation domain-containing protein
LESTDSRGSKPAFHRAARGFTMIELMITLAVIAILTAIVAPYFRDIILANEMTGTGQGHWGNWGNCT